MSRILNLGSFSLILLLYAPCAAESPENARLMLQKLKVPVTVTTYIDRLKEGDSRTVRLLIDAGISPDSVTEVGMTGIMIAAETGHMDLVKILIDAGAKLDIKDELYGRTALMKAADKEYPQIVQALIKAKADVNTSSQSHVHFGITYRGGDTALMYAAAKGNAAIVRDLLQAGADPSASNESGDTALTWATKRGNAEVVKILNEALKQKAGQTSSSQ